MDIRRIEPREWNSRAVVYENLVFLSGIVADDKSVPVKEQTAQVLGKIDEFLAEAGTDKTRILSSTVYMADLTQKDQMNEVWWEYFGDHRPGTATIEITRLAAHPNLKVELSAIVAVD